MTIAEVPAEARAAVLARRRKEIDELDYRRELRRLDQHGYSQREIAKWLGIAQPSVLSALRTAAKVPMPLDGFSGATPYEICQRYAAGFIDRAKLVDELTRFPYVKGGQTDGYDSLIVDPAGTWSEVSDAARRGLIEDDVYEEVFNRRHGIEPAPAQHANTKAAAVDRAREMVAKSGGGEIHVHGRKDGREVNVRARNGGAEHLTHGTDGRVVDRSSTTADPRTARRL
ncbi:MULTISPECIES: DUF2188 domain-containing protein [unclassified Microbacterium]|jgi:Uncharacterized protein conserved in bacteria (DUF2188)|uniref:DUF2188 domain-containing protein n=1 Tax=unclassified Microbacterium TaxID=2609290 RepID=UPI0021A4A237|nr:MULTISPECIES: DUF2188 domain-containing protein [unclassified Microbacterium]MCT1366122.1 DUF2188 domain-containing protein [Microbacterium sp. p3-SID131]MCT1378269.1 DUF2188 domain-containing protein [Microbacterium sp. p3-SID337]